MYKRTFGQFAFYAKKFDIVSLRSNTLPSEVLLQWVGEKYDYVCVEARGHHERSSAG